MTPDHLLPDHLLLDVSATDQASPTIRLAAAQLAAQCGFDHDRIADVQIAVSEALRLLLAAKSPDVDVEARLTSRFIVERHAFTLEAGLVGATGGSVDDVTEESERIFTATTTSYSILTAGPGTPEVTVHFDRAAPTGAILD